MSFAIYRYLQTLSENTDLTIMQDKGCILPDRLVFNGTRIELVDVLSQMMDREDAETLSRKLLLYRDLFDQDEYIEVKEQRGGGGGNNRFNILPIDDWDYNINLKALSLAAIALILDIKLRIGIASTALAIIGVSGQAIVEVSAEEAEKCLIREAILQKPHIIDTNIFKDTMHECVHNNYNCRFKKNGMCLIAESDIEKILDRLSEKNVFTKIGDRYKYNF